MMKTQNELAASVLTTSVFDRWQHVRQRSLAIAQHLSAEDCMAQSMPDASPIKWHLAHTSWFFETFVLEKFEIEFAPFCATFRVLFNSYYNGVGEKHPRAQRGLLTRPSLQEVQQYRQNVDQRISKLWSHLTASSTTQTDQFVALLELGLQHEQQHQELMLTDIKHLFWCNPMAPSTLPEPEREPASNPSALRLSVPPETTIARSMGWCSFAARLIEIGHRGEEFFFDNEVPRHHQFVEAFEFASRLVSNGEYLAFIEAGGYQNPALWLAEGWDWLLKQDVRHPIYWQLHEQYWRVFTQHGWQALDLAQPVCHLSYFEAAAFAQWAGARLPTEFEWEYAAQQAQQEQQIEELFEHCWQWTSSSYAAYPGFEIPAGAIGEYNGKFMVNQYVLRGSSCFTSENHARISYRNFFPVTARWQMSGIRLARSIRANKSNAV